MKHLCFFVGWTSIENDDQGPIRPGFQLRPHLTWTSVHVKVCVCVLHSEYEELYLCTVICSHLQINLLQSPEESELIV